MSLQKPFILAGVLLVTVAILFACNGTPTTETPTTQAPETPYLADWQSSDHADVAGEPFRHWDAEYPAEVPPTCARCHTSAGYRDFLGADGSEAHQVDAAVSAQESQGIQCV